METRKEIRKRLARQKRSSFAQKSIGVTTALASTSGVFATIVHADETNNSNQANSTQVTRSLSEQSINKKFQTTAALNVRSDASTASRIVSGLASNAQIQVVAQKQGTAVNGNSTWYKLSTGGWVTGAYLKDSGSSSSNNTATGTEQAISKTFQTTTALNVRSNASTSAGVVSGLAANAKIQVVAQKQGTSVNGNSTWYKLSSGGWVTGAYLKEASNAGSNNSSNASVGNNTASAEQAISKTFQTTTALNVRSNATTSAGVVSGLAANARVQAVAQKQGTSVNGNSTWYKLSTGGWVTAAYLKEATSNSGSTNGNNTASSSVNRAAIVNEARKHIGKPYQWGGKGPNAFDCSGLVRYVYLQVTGKNIGDWSVPQESAGTVIAVSAAEPGDLLFWGDRGNSYHVAISTGTGNYIHAPNTGQNVTEASSQYFAPDFAVRVK